MKTKFLELKIIFALLASTLFNGCMNANPDDQTIPWGRPADWEQSSPFYGG